MGGMRRDEAGWNEIETRTPPQRTTNMKPIKTNTQNTLTKEGSVGLTSSTSPPPPFFPPFHSERVPESFHSTW